ncbi:MAG: 5'/3'-nucleotidase SurE [bacterium]|nr:5'/3'-nucleotidase SurE [bacterium]
MASETSILITNDDGFDAPGLRTLASALKKAGDLVIIAPEAEKSGASHAITAFEEIVTRKARISWNGNSFSGYRINGTPTDCVRIGILELLADKPAFVASGINRGGNYGADVQYSGTVAAALEAAMFGIPAIAFSLQFDKDENEQRWDTCERIVPGITGYFLDNPIPKGTIINVNIPNLPIADIKGIRLARLSSAVMDDSYIRNEISQNELSFKLRFSGRHELRGNPDEDYNLVHEGYIAITPLHFDLTDNSQIGEMQSVISEIEEIIEHEF